MDNTFGNKPVSGDDFFGREAYCNIVIQTGINNTEIGFNTDIGFSNYFNYTSIGNNAVSGASNKIRKGNLSISLIEGQVAYSRPSDDRFKSDNCKGAYTQFNMPPLKAAQE